jgi:hypothetical protein
MNADKGNPRPDSATEDRIAGDTLGATVGAAVGAGLSMIGLAALPAHAAIVPIGVVGGSLAGILFNELIRKRRE